MRGKDNRPWQHLSWNNEPWEIRDYVFMEQVNHGRELFLRRDSAKAAL